MNRRDFLKCTLGAAFCLVAPLPGLEQRAAAEDFPGWEPPIYKRFFHFTEYDPRPATEFIVIHHSGFPDADKDSDAASIHKFHQGVNGWAGIGYHYLIRKNGMIEQGRRPEMIGAHALHFNHKSIGICLAGNFDIGRPTEAQMRSLQQLSLWLCQKYRLEPLKKGVIVGHRDLNDTRCPGDALYRQLYELKRFCHDNMSS